MGPSDFDELKEVFRNPSQEDVTKLLKSLKEFVESFRGDSCDEDLINEVALELNNADVWEHINMTDFHTAVLGGNMKTVTTLLGFIRND